MKYFHERRDEMIDIGGVVYAGGLQDHQRAKKGWRSSWARLLIVAQTFMNYLFNRHKDTSDKNNHKQLKHWEIAPVTQVVHGSGELVMSDTG